MPESVTWLYNKGRYEQIEKIIKQAARVNKMKPPQETLRMLQELRGSGKQPLSNQKEKNQSQGRSQSMLDLMKTPRIRLYTVVQGLIW